MVFTSDIFKRVRDETPSCLHQIHFNNAGASLMPNPVYNALKDHLDLERRIGGYAAEAQAKDKLAAFYTCIARLINASPSDIAFTQNHTRAWETAIRAINWQEGDRLMIHDSAYSSNYLTFLHLKKTKGIALDIIPGNDNGVIDLDTLPKLLSPRTKAIAVTHMPTFDGTVQPVQAIGQFAKEHGLIYSLDACQSVGQAAVDVNKIGCHILAGTGRKWLRGPRGTGFLYIASEILETLTPPLIDNIAARQTGPSDFEWSDGAKRFETYERHIAGQIGLGIAAEYADNLGMHAIETRIQALASHLRHALKRIPTIEVLEDTESASGIVTFHAGSFPAHSIVQSLWEKHIAVSFVSPEQAYFKFKRLSLSGAVRASVHYYNSEDEIETICQTLRDMLR